MNKKNNEVIRDFKHVVVFLIATLTVLPIAILFRLNETIIIGSLMGSVFAFALFVNRNNEC